MTDPDIYLIWSAEHQAWWGPGECGYVGKVSEAGRYRYGKALDIATKAIPGTAQRFGLLPEIPVRLADIETMQMRYRGTFPGRPPERWE
jgi:hypothetical protein